MNTHLDTVQSIYRAFGTGDVPTILATLAPQVQWEIWPDHSAQRAGHPLMVPRRDPASVGEFFQAVGQTLTIHEFQVCGLIGDGRDIVAQVILDCTYVATGVRIRDEELHLWCFDEQGRVARFRHYLDSAKHMRAAGLLPG